MVDEQTDKSPSRGGWRVSAAALAHDRFPRPARSVVEIGYLSPIIRRRKVSSTSQPHQPEEEVASTRLTNYEMSNFIPGTSPGGWCTPSSTGGRSCTPSSDPSTGGGSCTPSDPAPSTGRGNGESHEERLYRDENGVAS